MAFEEQGFCIVRGPDALWGGDIHNFHPPAGRFEGVIGGPPCQKFSRLRHLVEANGLKTAENLIPEFERVVFEAAPAWFLMENVPAAPEPKIAGYSISSVRLNNRWFGGEQSRERVFSFGVAGESQAVKLEPYLIFELFENYLWSPAICASGGVKPGISKDNQKRAKSLGWKTATALKESLRLQGLPENFLDKSPFTLKGKHKVIGNGVPLPLGRAVAVAVKAALQQREADSVIMAQMDFLELDRGCFMNGSTESLVGLLWHDPAAADWRERVGAAVARHNERFGYRANLCHVAPETLNVPPPASGPQWVETIAGVDIYANDGVRPNHFFVARRMERPRPVSPASPAAVQLALEA